jgi:hypothetical protein
MGGLGHILEVEKVSLADGFNVREKSRIDHRFDEKDQSSGEGLGKKLIGQRNQEL